MVSFLPQQSRKNLASFSPEKQQRHYTGGWRCPRTSVSPGCVVNLGVGAFRAQETFTHMLSTPHLSLSMDPSMLHPHPSTSYPLAKEWSTIAGFLLFIV